MVQKLFALFSCLSCLFVGALPSAAMETDQYNLSPTPLADIAPEVEAYVAQKIQTAVDKLNDEIAKHERCLKTFPSDGFGTRPPSTEIVEAPARRPVTCGSEKLEQSKLTQLRSPDALAKAVYDQLGSGTIFTTKTGVWLNTHKFEHEPSRYKAPFAESIYITAPVNYATLSPTIRMYDVEFGTDKLDHMFQQGYSYFRKYTSAKNSGKSDAEALKTAVAYGRFTENTFFGYTVSGVYSNADLAANIAGLRFYQSLATDVADGDVNWPQPVKLRDGKWTFNKPESDRGGVAEARASARAIADCGTSLTAVNYSTISYRPCSRAGFRNLVPETSSSPSPFPPFSPSLLRPFITDHLNEALNPSNYLFFLYPVVKSVIKKHACPEWHAAFPTASHESLTQRSAALTTWNGLDYGYKTTSRQPHIADLCFADRSPREAER